MREIEGISVEDAPMCPFCGTAGRVLYQDLRDRYWDAPGTWTFRRCPTCRHVWLDPRPVPGEVGKLYASYFTYEGETAEPSTFSENGFWGRSRRGVLVDLGYTAVPRSPWDPLLSKLLRLVPPLREGHEQSTRSVFGPPRGTLVDVGCGDGSFLQYMRALGWQVRGVEPDPKAARVARQRQIEVLERPIEDADLPDAAFDVITMSHVIEHVLDPFHTFEICHRALKPDGTLVVITPNVDSWGHRIFERAWFSLDPPRHLHLFSMETLKACAEGAGIMVTGLKTSALRAHLVYDGSSAVQKTGHFDQQNRAWRASTRARIFRLAEYAILLSRLDAGEEILLTGVKGQPS